jgi:hypothetical protein
MHSESQWRYRAYRQGLRLVKYKKSSTAYEQYGPYALADLATNRVVHVNLHPIDVERALFRDTDETSPASRTG